MSGHIFFKLYKAIWKLSCIVCWILIIVVVSAAAVIIITIIIILNVCRSWRLCARCCCTQCSSVSFLFEWYNYSSLVHVRWHLLKNLLWTYQFRLCCCCLTKWHGLCQLWRGSYAADLAWWHTQPVGTSPCTVCLVDVCAVKWRHCNGSQVTFIFLILLVSRLCWNFH